MCVATADGVGGLARSLTCSASGVARDTEDRGPAGVDGQCIFAVVGEFDPIPSVVAVCGHTGGTPSATRRQTDLDIAGEIGRFDGCGWGRRLGGG